ncbi:MAG: WbqC family protein [Candidatus Eremiobacteraeota bacterium]|nr:WbqC family protein [Candidatus Eremiobacteraeota bacterium]
MEQSKTVAVLQPSYLPWLGYLDQIAKSDVFVFYDDVQYDKNGWRNRNRIRTGGPDGWSWLTVPVTATSHFPPICEVRVDERAPWQRKHLKTLRAEYSRAPHLDLLDRHFGRLLDTLESSLANVAIESVRAMMAALAIDTTLYRSSELDVPGDRNTRLLGICKHFRATTYLSGEAARGYLDVPMFEREGIAVEFQSYHHPVYPQTREPFISHLSAIDALLNAGSATRAFLGA